MPRHYGNRYIEELYDQITIDDHLEALRAKGLQYRVKIIKSGDILEVEIYPINLAWKELAGKKREKLLTPSRNAQRNLNDQNTRKYVSRLIHTNFSEKDIWLTLTYNNENMPVDIPAATKHLKNYFKRLRRYIKKHNLPELKYIYVTERTESETTGKIHTHHHIILNFTDRDKAEELWTMGGRTQARKLQPDDSGLEGLARYIAKPETKEKNRKGVKTYATSLNLKKPKINTADNRLPTTNYRLSKRRVAAFAKNENLAIEMLEKNLEGYKNTQPIKKCYSEFSPGVYMYARLKKTHDRKGEAKCKKTMYPRL
ncbi:MAG: hypothetical protein FWB80_00085 [Defluviitaleaceae bacterium]|nr:hypothetical protein [Defluviitaleaceae bacterium]